MERPAAQLQRRHIGDRGLTQIVDSPDTGYARFETGGGVTFSVQIDHP